MPKLFQLTMYCKLTDLTYISVHRVNDMMLQSAQDHLIINTQHNQYALILSFTNKHTESKKKKYFVNQPNVFLGEQFNLIYR